jgi:hypothetical protein
MIVKLVEHGFIPFRENCKRLQEFNIYQLNL